MSRSRSWALVKGAALATGLTLVLGGCSYDYMQRTDRVAFSSGNAVKANLEQVTINPSKGSMNKTTGLGKDGPVIPPSTQK